MSSTHLAFGGHSINIDSKDLRPLTEIFSVGQKTLDSHKSLLRG